MEKSAIPHLLQLHVRVLVAPTFMITGGLPEPRAGSCWLSISKFDPGSKLVYQPFVGRDWADGVDSTVRRCTTTHLCLQSSEVLPEIVGVISEIGLDQCCRHLHLVYRIFYMKIPLRFLRPLPSPSATARRIAYPNVHARTGYLRCASSIHHGWWALSVFLPYFSDLLLLHVFGSIHKVAMTCLGSSHSQLRFLQSKGWRCRIWWGSRWRCDMAIEEGEGDTALWMKIVY